MLGLIIGIVILALILGLIAEILEFAGIWFWIVLLVALVLFVLFKVGIFRKKAKCVDCGKDIKGTEQTVFSKGKTRFVLCKDCAKKIDKQIFKEAKIKWNFENYRDYLAWEEETREEREKFMPTIEYGHGDCLMIDQKHKLFSMGKVKGLSDVNIPGIVLRFADIEFFNIDFKPETIKEGVIRSDCVEGTEFATIAMKRPFVVLKSDLNSFVKCAIKNGNSYSLSPEFQYAIDAFEECLYSALYGDGETMSDEQKENDEIKKALALFMFDNIEDVTEDSLKKQRNLLIKTFHPDNEADGTKYAAKINTAYELLKSKI